MKVVLYERAPGDKLLKYNHARNVDVVSDQIYVIDSAGKEFRYPIAEWTLQVTPR